MSTAEQAPSILEPGTRRPGLRLEAWGRQREYRTRADLEGQTTVLVFYPFAFSPVCTDQLNLYEEVLDDFSWQHGAPASAVCIA